MRVALVTGATGMLGRALLTRLAGAGVQVIATGRSRQAVAAAQDLGARPLYTDIANLGAWRDEVRSADVVFHLAKPSAEPPLHAVRARRNARLARQRAEVVARIADGRPVVTASSGLVYGGDAEPHDEADAVRPLAFALADVAAERAFDPEATRVLRTGWVYGDGGVFAMLVLALAARRHRIVGPGDNLWSLVSAEDAANALVRLASLPAGVYHASESDERPPTQDDVVDALCKGGLRRPDRAPRWLATATIGGPMAEALGASLWLTAERLRAAGWVAASDWRAALANLARAPGGRPGRPGAGGGGRA